MSQSQFRAGFVALIGAPNAGKSTLLNVLIEEKVSIVSPKPQTTRRRVTGILNRPGAQVVFVDAPGVIKSSSGINKFLRDEAADVMDSVDVVCLLLAADQDEKTAEELLASVRRSRKPWVVIVTKSDLLGGTRTPRFFKTFIDEKIPFISVSTLKRPDEARDEVLNRVLSLIPEAPAPLYDTEIHTTETLRQMAAEFVREACFRHLRQEIPYGLAVKTTDYKEEEGLSRVRCEIIVDKPNAKAIVIGAGGAQIKQIGTEARKDLERISGAKIFLELHVQVQEGWTENPRLMKELGYVVVKE